MSVCLLQKPFSAPSHQPWQMMYQKKRRSKLYSLGRIVQMMYQKKAHNPGKVEIIFCRSYSQYVAH